MRTPACGQKSAWCCPGQNGLSVKNSSTSTIRLRHQPICFDSPMTFSMCFLLMVRGRPHVSAVLNGRIRGPDTLLLIEKLVMQVKAGEITPR